MLKGQKMKRTFHDNLILNRYLLSLFNQDNLEKFKQHLGDDRFEGIDNDGQTRFFHELTGGQLFQTDLISANDLRRYDLNIVKHWQQITENRNKAEGHIRQMMGFRSSIWRNLVLQICQPICLIKINRSKARACLMIFKLWISTNWQIKTAN